MWRPVLMINGFIMLIMGVMMTLPAAALYYFSGKPDYVFIQSAVIAVFLGGALFLANFGKIEKISILEGYLITVSCWFVTPLVAALPFLFNDSFEGVYDAVFEATAGITATGATVLKDVEAEPKSVLLWRAMLNGLGGVGIVIFAVALSPFLGTGGMHLFNKENSDTEEKFLPKIRYIANDIILVYILLNLCCAGLLKAAGMNWFDALCFALATLSTGGMTIKNASIGFYDSGLIEGIVGIFMILGALPFTYYVLVFKKRSLEAVTGNPQINGFLKFLFAFILFFSCCYMFEKGVSFLEAVRVVGFNLTAAVTTTGMYSSDYLAWGSWAAVVFLILFLTGGCTGSTTGSIKIFRWQVVAAFLKKHSIKAVSPNQVAVMKTGNKVIDDNIAASVFALILAFLLAIVFFTLVLCLSGLDFLTAFGAVVGNITGAGSGFNEAVGPNGNFAAFSPFVKYVLSFVMVLGRLEVITVLVLFFKIRFK
ncbi:MAG: TrkH family potassium uptake protein [Alphaproteobacteria bacterium]|nr:TrkH family potassium uptake protein [Alphaproteobacteria bacterium]